ncbi:MAG: Amino acid adenylation [Proteobacteria bacterium]|nr:Amino acid adenylation [Pseudomonadota bacterium]
MKIADFSFDDETDDVRARPTPVSAPASRETAVSRFALWASRRPNEPALVDEQGSMSYAELDATANRVAGWLVSLDLDHEARVGVMMERGRAYIAAALGILKAGCVYVPLDPTQPISRRRSLVDGSEMVAMIGEGKTLGDVRTLAWTCHTLKAGLCLDADDPDQVIEIPGIMMSSELWNHVAGEATDDVGAGGWTSAFTGLPIGEAIMERFGDNARAKTGALLTPASRVLEIGCASGFTMRRVAPLCGRYVASDLTRLNAERTETVARQLGLDHVIGRQLAAHDLDVLEPGSFDLIIFNSVIENFPGFGYLADILDKAMTVLAPGGTLYLGGLWDLDRRDAYLGDLSAFARDHAGEGLTTRRQFDDQLFISRAFLRDWAARHGQRPSLDFSDVVAADFDPAPYLFDCVVRMDGLGQGTGRSLRLDGGAAIDGLPAHLPAVAINPTSAAYVMFTSGSTGLPKATWVEHASLVNLADSAEATIYRQLGQGGRITNTCVFSFGFDGSIHQIFTTLLNGHTLIIPSDETRRDPPRLHEFIEQHHIVCCDATPSMFAMLIDHWQESGTHTSSRCFILGGEEVKTELLRQLYAIEGHGDLRIVNQYGPTEACVCATQYFMSATNWARSLPPPIGKPLSGVDVRLTDAAGRDVPDGVPGEIRIGGRGVARGYLNDPGRTAVQFVIDPDGVRRYRTGDMARRLSTGDLVFMGREDRQVKIRGHRIELAEVELALAAHPLVRRVAVTAIAGSDGEKALVAYVVPRPGFEPVTARAEFDRTMPAWTVPSWLVEIEDLPLNSNGKLDERRLPPPAELTARGDRERRPLAGDIERRLAAVWSTVLETPIDDGNDDFFMMGGHSVLAVRLMAAIEREFDHRPPLADLFTHATVARMASLIERRPTVQWTPIVKVNAEGSRPPLICFHPVGGNVLCYRDLAAKLGPDQPVTMVQSIGLEDDRPLPSTVEGLVDVYMEPLRAALPEGPVAIAGWSFGSLLAWEAAGRLIRGGVDVRAIIVLDGVATPEVVREMIRKDESDFLADLFDEMGLFDAETLRRLTSEQRIDLILERGKGGKFLPDGMDRAGMRRLLSLFQNNGLAAARYRPHPLDVKMLLVRPTGASKQAPGVPGDPLNGWGDCARGGVELRWMGGTHGQMLEPSHVGELAEYVRTWLDEAADPSRNRT